MDKLKLDIQYFANATCTLTVKETVNKTGNSSTFTITGKVTTGSQTFNSSAYMKGSYSGGASGTLSKKTFSISKSDSVSKTWEITVNHNSDGTLDDIKFTLDWYVTSSDTSHGTVTKTVSPTDIPRQATITTAPDFTDDEDPTITYSNPAGDAVTTLQARIASSDNDEGYAAYRAINKFVENDDGSKTTTGLSYEFELTSEERKLLRQKASSSNTLDVRFVVKTVIGGDTFTDYLKKKMTIANPEPTVTATVVDSNPDTIALTGDENTFVKYFSSASYEITAEAKKESTITSYGASCGSKSKLTSSGIFENVDSGTFIFTATDSRKNTTSTTLIKNIVEYVKLTCNISDNRPDVNGEMLVECSGNYFNNTFGAVENTLSVQYRYKESGGEYNSWTPMTISLDGNSYTATADLSDLDHTKNYIFQTRAIDALHPDGVNSIEKSVRTIPVYDWGEDDFAFNVPVTGTDISAWMNTTVKNLPSGAGDREYWNGLPNGEYWYNKDLTTITEYMPYDYGFVYKIGTYNPGDFSVLFSCQPSGKIFRKCGSSVDVTAWKSLVYTSDLYPVGSCYTTNTNTNPSTLGVAGTWELIDKEFKSEYIYSTDTTYATWGKISALGLRLDYSGHDIHLNMTFTNNAQLNDDTDHTICTLKLSALGVATINNECRLPHMYFATGYTTDGNCITMISISRDGLVELNDLIPDDYISASKPNYCDITISLNKNMMKDALCDKFIWKRTA